MISSYKEYIEANWENIKRDISRLVAVPSVKSQKTNGAPYGSEIRRCQLEAMAMCREAGLDVTDLDGRIAYAHYGDSEYFVGIIAHIDIVPDGTGWDSDPFSLTERDGYLVGRGVLDDKGPFVLALYAIKYLIENNITLNYGIRLIIGLDEESGMSDIAYYNKNCTKPAFAFTPDSSFPVCHGEKGIFEANIVSPKIKGRRAIRKLSGGLASNIVADYAFAELDAEYLEPLETLAQNSEAVNVTVSDYIIKVEAYGIAKHAGTPEGGVNAINVLFGFLLESGILYAEEKKAAEFIYLATGTTDGEQFDIACDDGKFTPLSIIGGLISLSDDSFVLNINCRYPTTITPAQLEKKIKDKCTEHGFSTQTVLNSPPFYLDPENAAVKLMCGIYNGVSGKNEQPFVMAGGTYARHMENTVSYGIESPNQKHPEWAGSAHMKNEAVNIESAKQACLIFIETLIKLQDIDFNS